MMLRCPPSLISLTASDLNGLDERLAARHSARLAKQKASNIRLQRGPGHATNLSIVSAEDNVGRKRARSSVSEATFDRGDSGRADIIAASDVRLDETSDGLRVPSPPRLQGPGNELHSNLEEVKTLENITQRQSPKRAQGRQQSADLNDSENTDAQYYPRDISQVQVDAFDGILEQPASPDRQVPDPTPGQRLLSSARARRWRGRGHDFRTHESTDETLSVEPYNNFCRDTAHGRRVEGNSSAIPEVYVFGEDSRTTQHPSLDPGAPAFVPRTRFGSVTRSFVERDSAEYESPQWGSLDSTRNVSNLRILPTSEQNIEIQNPRPYDQSRHAAIVSTRPYRNQNSTIAPQRSSFGLNQHAAIMQPAPHFERYPVWRTSLSIDARHETHSLPPPSSAMRPGISSSSSRVASPALNSVSGQGHRQPHFRIQSAFTSETIDAGTFHPRTRSASPAVSTLSRSTPNLLSMPGSAPQIGSRGSSWSWAQSYSGQSSQSRVSRMVSAASGISRGDAPRQSSRQELDAADEFIRRRNSPLDELTERLSRMRSVGHSWGRPPSGRTRPSLLNGNPFGPISTTDEARMRVNDTMPFRPSIAPVQRPVEQEEDVPDADPVALSLALPPSSPLPSGAQIVPSSPPLPGSFPTSPMPALAQISPSRACDFSTSPIPRKPLPRTATTPKINVYDDSQPPNTQPQTPADVGRSRRTRKNSASVAQQSPTMTGSGTVESLPEDSQRRPSRDTRSSIPPSHTGHRTAASTSTTSETTVVANLSRAAHRERARRRAPTQRNSEQAENDAEDQLLGLEEDRRTWLSRHGDGTLEITPPKEGRFERFLS